MRLNRLFTAGFLVAGLLGALQASTAQTVANPGTVAAAPAQTAPSPLADTGLLAPAPVNRAGTQGGPCTVSVTCRSGDTLTCTGQANCQWKGDGIPSLPGYVQCDGFRRYCPP